MNFIKNLKFQSLNPNILQPPKRINRSLCNEEIEFYRILNKQTKLTLVKYLLNFWENSKSLTKKEIIPSLQVLNLFEKENIDQLDINQFLKNEFSTPLKVVSNNLKEKIKANSYINKKYELKNDQYFLYSGEWIYKANKRFITFKGKKDHDFQ